MLDEYDIALYTMEHFDFYGEVNRVKNQLHIKRIIFLKRKEMPLTIETCLLR